MLWRAQGAHARGHSASQGHPLRGGRGSGSKGVARRACTQGGEGTASHAGSHPRGPPESLKAMWVQGVAPRRRASKGRRPRSHKRMQAQRPPGAAPARGRGWRTGVSSLLGGPPFFRIVGVKVERCWRTAWRVSLNQFIPAGSAPRKLQGGSRGRAGGGRRAAPRQRPSREKGATQAAAPKRSTGGVQRGQRRGVTPSR
ncbi:MAG: hypothetical protein J3K34DRAFT_440723 [Monoraphidium minutum]|nr:MAG: hypothetical protein J3K34DRAFT_440723 [Monoraphidium minutum]